MVFDFQPTLRGELLTLRPLRADDFDGLFAAASDPLIWEQHPARDRGEAGPFRAFFDESLQSGGALVACDRRDARIIGSSRFHAYDHAHSEGRNRLDVPCAITLGRPVQPRDEAADAASCLRFR